MLTPGADPVRKVSIIPRGQALGVTLSTPDDDRFNYSEDELRAKIRVSLGGRAAEELVFGEATTGAESDIQQVTRIARGMVERWGMSEKVGFLDGRPAGRPEPAAARRRAGLRGDAGADRRRRCAGSSTRRWTPRPAARREPRQARRARRGAARARDAGRGRRLRGGRNRARRRSRPMSDLIERALAEDLGDGDLTTQAVVPEGAQARARIEQKEPGVIAGLSAARAGVRASRPGARVRGALPGGRTGASPARSPRSRARPPRSWRPSGWR